MQSKPSRRSFLALAAAAAPLAAQTPRDWTNGMPTRYPDADVIVSSPKFEKYKTFNAVIYRHYVGCKWAEGPAWSEQGNYLVWSDIPNNRQLRFIEDDGGHASTFRPTCGYSNGNTFDYQGRQISCEHAGRRVSRYEHDGKVTTIADKYNGKPLSSPNDAVVHPTDGSIWFTDPPYGIMGDYEGFPAKQENKEAIYRVDAQSGRVEMLADDVDKPNGICFSHDYKKLYVVNTGSPKEIVVWDINGTKLANRKQFTNFQVRNEVKNAMGQAGGDGVRVDVDGNVWAAASGGPGLDGVIIFSPAGEKIGHILLPEICANLCFGGPKRNRLYMCGSQSLYSVYVNTRGAHVS